MQLFNFFRRKKKENQEIKEVPSPEQQEFSNTVVKIFTSFLNDNGFALIKVEVKEYSATITFRKGTQYIRISSSTYPTDYPYFYNVILGDGDSEDFFEYDWNSVALWRLKQKVEPDTKAQEYSFPYGDDLIHSLRHAKDDLTKYGDKFLQGDLVLFIAVRKEQNQNREPYRISYVDENGKRQITFDEESLNKKNKYS